MKMLPLLLLTSLLYTSCSSTDSTGLDTSQDMVDSIVTARTDSARNALSAANDSIINTTAARMADSQMANMPAPAPADTLHKTDIDTAHRR